MFGFFCVGGFFGVLGRDVSWKSVIGRCRVYFEREV